MSYNYNYLGLVNRVLEDFNEVLLDSTTFTTATGFQGAVKDWINDAINDIYSFEDTRWPFLWSQKTFNTVIGQGLYSYDPTALYVDWDSFNITRPYIPVDSLVQSSGVVTATVSAGHQLMSNRNDAVIVQGAAQTDYNGEFTPVIVSSTVFTYTIANTGAVSPATGTLLMIPPYSNQYLGLKNYDEYNRNWRDIDIGSVRQNLTNQSPSEPRFIVRKPDNNFIISPYPDRIYTIGYDAFLTPTELSLYTDVPLIPKFFKQVIIDRANVYALAFRDNDSQLLRNDDKFEKSCNAMRRNQIPQAEFIVAKP